MTIFYGSILNNSYPDHANVINENSLTNNITNTPAPFILATNAYKDIKTVQQRAIILIVIMLCCSQYIAG